MPNNNNQQVNLPVISPIEGELLKANSTLNGGNGGGDEYQRGLRDGVVLGVRAGYEQGFIDCHQFVQAQVQDMRRQILNDPELKRALAEGLRLGSPECGKAIATHYRHK